VIRPLRTFVLAGGALGTGAVSTFRSAQAFLLKAIDLGVRRRRRDLSLSAGCAAVGSPAGPGRHRSASSR
jgi:hypothetical protein